MPECVHDDRLNVLGLDSPYCDLDDINGTIETFSKAKYCAIHVNIHSLPSKFAELRNTPSKLKDNGIIVHFVLLCETFLTQINADKYSMPGYNFVHASRTSLSRGGVAIYILKGLNFKERPDLCINIEGQFESLTVEIEDRQGKGSLIISEIYRVPNTNEKLSMERYDEIITALCSTHKDIMIGTDQNFDYMKVNVNKNISDLLNVFFTSGVLPTVKRPTRITHTSATVIDNIYVKSQRYENIDSRVILSDISDHFPIIACMSVMGKSVKRAPLVFSHRPIDTTKLGKLAEALTRTDWVNVLVVKVSVNAMMHSFSTLMCLWMNTSQ